MKLIETDQAPTAIGPYSQALSKNGFVFISGQPELTRHGELVAGTEAQTPGWRSSIWWPFRRGRPHPAPMSLKPPFMLSMDDFALSTNFTLKFSPRRIPRAKSFKSRVCPRMGVSKFQRLPRNDYYRAPYSHVVADHRRLHRHVQRRHPLRGGAILLARLQPPSRRHVFRLLPPLARIRAHSRRTLWH